MHDLNDLYFFVQVVDHGGFAPAGRALGVPKSRLSRRIAQLEERLDVRLINRSTRQFAVTEIGREYYRRCVAMLVEAEAAEETVERTRAAPRGTVRLSCPPGLIYFHVGAHLVRFMEMHPEVRIEMTAASRRVDVIQEGYDLAIRVRYPPLEDSELSMRKLSESPQCLMAAPDLVARIGRAVSPSDLSRYPSLDFEQTDNRHVWRLDGPDGAAVRVGHSPRLVTDDVFTLLQAAQAGLGVVQMPLIVGGTALTAGLLVSVLPTWRPRSGILHAVFPTRRGLVPAVRALLDHLAQSLDDIDFSIPDQ